MRNGKNFYRKQQMQRIGEYNVKQKRFFMPFSKGLRYFRYFIGALTSSLFTLYTSTLFLITLPIFIIIIIIIVVVVYCHY